MQEPARSQAVAECVALCNAYGELADSGQADAFADLYTPDGVFDRLGQLIEGREALRKLIAGRPAGVWTRHGCSNVRVEVAPDLRSASGEADLEMQRGREDSSEVEEIRARYLDRFVLTELGWRFAARKVVLLP